MPRRSKDVEEDDKKTLSTDPEQALLFGPNPFTNMADELVEFAEYDSELAEGLRFIDREAQKRGITFYEMLYKVIDDYGTDSKAKEWVSGLRTEGD